MTDNFVDLCRIFSSAHVYAGPYRPEVFWLVTQRVYKKIDKSYVEQNNTTSYYWVDLAMGMYLHNLHLFGGTNFGLTSCKLFVHCRCECVTHYLWLSLELFLCIYFTLISVKLYIFDYFLHLCVHASEVARVRRLHGV